LLVEHFPEKSDPYLSSNRRRPSTAYLEAHSWIKSVRWWHQPDMPGRSDDVR
jgi:hypothetical protein